jgi:Tfp pilus assembly protein PilO
MMTRILPFAALVLAAAIILGYIVPTYKNSIVGAQAQIQSYQNALTAAQSFSAKEADLEQQRAGISADNLARLTSFLPDGVNNVQLILDLDGLAARSGMVLSNFDIDVNSVSNGTDSSDPTALALQSSSPIDSVQLTVETTGSYAQFRTFLSGLEQSLRPLDVTDLTVTPSDTGNYKYDLTIRIYWLH